MQKHRNKHEQAHTEDEVPTEVNEQSQQAMDEADETLAEIDEILEKANAKDSTDRVLDYFEKCGCEGE